MAIKILEIHHSAVRIRPGAESVAEARDFYTNVLGLLPDPGRPELPDLDGYWLDVGDVGQVHLMAYEGEHPLSQGKGKDPSLPHIAFGVADIEETERELKRLGAEYWTIGVLGATDRRQLFLADPSGNVLELHQADTCRCSVRNRIAADAAA